MPETLPADADFFRQIVTGVIKAQLDIDPAIDKALTAKAGPVVSMLTRFQAEWFDDTNKWVDAVMKVTAAESDANKAQLREWLAKWHARARTALEPVAKIALGEQGGEALDNVGAALNARMAKAGIPA